jgi:uncharacterized protein (TIGR02996 family)
VTSRDDLLRVIDENPDDHESWMLYADWLQQRDEPRGELIALDVALETATDDQKVQLEVARHNLIAKYATNLLGETFSKFVASGYGTVTWHRGFVSVLIYAGNTRVSHKRAVGWLVKLIVDNPEPFTFLKKLGLAHTDIADISPFVRFKHLAEIDLVDTNVKDIAPLLFLPRLKRLALRDCPIPQDALDDFKRQRPQVVVRHGFENYRA